MKILFITDSPFYPIEGGADRVVYEQATGLAKKGYETAVVCRDKKQFLVTKTVVDGVKAYYVGVRGKKGKPSFFNNYTKLKPLLKHLFKKYDWDAVIFHQPLLAFFARHLLAHRKMARLYSFHSPVAYEYLLRNDGFPPKIWAGKNILNFMESWAVKQCDLVLFYSRYMENLSQEVHSSIGLMPREVIPLGVDLDHFACKKSSAAARESLKLWPGRPLALTVRNLEPRMGLEGLLEAWKMVLSTFPDAVLLIGGEGSLKLFLEDKIRKFGLEQNVRLAGFISETDLPTYYQAADFFILPTRELEGFGLVTLESLACGTPVLGTHVGAIPEVLGAFDSSLLFESRRAHIMAERIVKFIRDREWEKFSPERCRRFVEEHYSWERHIQKLETALMETIGITKRKK